MTERRQTDRRHLLPRDGGRRQTDPQPHGTRACYQNHGCRCTPCKAANADYEAQRVKDKAAGQQRLDAICTPQAAARAVQQVKSMRAEKITGRAINRLDGLKDHALVVQPSGKMRWRKVLRIQRRYRLQMQEDRDRPDEAVS